MNIESAIHDRLKYTLSYCYQIEYRTSLSYVSEYLLCGVPIMMNRSGSADNKAHIDRNIPLESKPKDYLLKKNYSKWLYRIKKIFKKAEHRRRLGGIEIVIKINLTK